MASAFEDIKEDICEELMKTKTFTGLKNKMYGILEDWDFEEED